MWIWGGKGEGRGKPIMQMQPNMEQVGSWIPGGSWQSVQAESSQASWAGAIVQQAFLGVIPEFPSHQHRHQHQQVCPPNWKITNDASHGPGASAQCPQITSVR